MKKLFSLTTLLLLLSLMGCDTVTKMVYNDADIAGSLNVVVLDAAHGQANVGATVTLLVNGSDRVVTTDAAGQASFADLPIGTYVYSVAKEGSREVFGTVTIASESADFTLVEDQTVVVSLKRAGVTVTGLIVYEDQNGIKQPAANATVSLALSKSDDSWRDAVIEVMTDATGRYRLIGVPEATAMSLNVLDFTLGGATYKNSTAYEIGGAEYGTTVSMDLITLEMDAPELLIMSDNLATVTTSTALSFTFSETIDITTANVVVREGSTTKLGTSFALSADKKTLTVSLNGNGTWETGTYYSVLLDVESELGVSLKSGDAQQSFSIGENTVVLGDVVGVQIQDSPANQIPFGPFSGTYTTVAWTGLAEASSYEVYVKTKIDTNFRLVSTTSTTSVGVYTNFTLVGDTMQFYVLAVNGNVKSAYTPLIIKTATAIPGE